MTNNDLQQLIARGVAAHESGRLDEAIAAYRAAHQRAPQDAESASLLGLALVHAGQLDEAGPLLEQAVASEPAESGFRLNLVEYLQRREALDEAAREVDTVLAAHPNHVRAWEKKGDIAVQRRQLRDAIDAYTQARGLDSKRYPIVLKLAHVQASAGQYTQAMETIQQGAELRPGDLALHDLHSEILATQRAWPQLEAFAMRWAQLQPQQPQAWKRLSQAVYEQGRYRQAMMAYEKVLAGAGRTAEHLTRYADISLNALEYDAAAKALDEAERLAPELPELLAARSLLLTYRGEFEAAEAYCQRCLAADPDQAAVYTQLSRLRRGRMSDEEIAQLNRYADDASKPAENRIAARFALAHAYDERGLIDQAFEAYSDANRVQIALAQSEQLAYDPAASQARTQRIVSSFTDAPPSDVAAPGGPRPIFIVGMPRSGTTLIESVLAAHSRVFAGGERPLVRQMLDGWLAFDTRGQRPDAAQLQQWAAGYVSELPDIAPADRFTDKNPLNFEAIGLIAQLFPDAPVVLVQRNPLETGLSIFCHEFSKFWSFAHSLADIGHYYGQYARLVHHWEEWLGERLIRIRYESFAGDFDNAAPRLLERCGLEWEQSCHDFASQVPVISTFSAVQAREPVRVREGRARAYRAHLQPLIEALDRAGVDPESGELR